MVEGETGGLSLVIVKDDGDVLLQVDTARETYVKPKDSASIAQFFLLP